MVPTCIAIEIITLTIHFKVKCKKSFYTFLKKKFHNNTDGPSLVASLYFKFTLKMPMTKLSDLQRICPGSLRGN